MAEYIWAGRMAIFPLPLEQFIKVIVHPKLFINHLTRSIFPCSESYPPFLKIDVFIPRPPQNFTFTSAGILKKSGRLSESIPIPVSPARRYLLDRGIEESRQHLDACNPVYFSNRLPSNQHWRLFPEFRHSTIYLDIETTGLDRHFNQITTITLYDGQSIKTYVQGQNLDDFVEDVQKFKVIVTYNGKCFDVPFIESYFNIGLNHAHIDLRNILQSLGFRGGLKGCERQLGIDRGDLRDIDGFFAVLLWDEYSRNGDQRALDTLLAYNVQDTVTLENLMVTAYNMKLQQTPFFENILIEESMAPINPYKVDRKKVERIKSGSQYWQSQQWY